MAQSVWLVSVSIWNWPCIRKAKDNASFSARSSFQSAFCMYRYPCDNSHTFSGKGVTAHGLWTNSGVEKAMEEGLRLCPIRAALTFVLRAPFGPYHAPFGCLLPSRIGPGPDVKMIVLCPSSPSIMSSVSQNSSNTFTAIIKGRSNCPYFPAFFAITVSIFLSVSTANASGMVIPIGRAPGVLLCSGDFGNA